VKNIVLAAAALAAALSPASAETRQFKADGVKTIRVETESGAVEARAGEKLEVEVLNNDKPELCDLTLETDGGALVLKAKSRSRGLAGLFGGGDECPAGFRVTAPAALALEAASGSGAIVVSARRGAVSARAGSGDIRLDGVAGAVETRTGSGSVSGAILGRLSARSGSGSIELAGLGADADVRTGSGDVKLSWSTSPEGRIDVKTGSGTVTLSFPKGTRLRADQLSGSGRRENRLGGSADAKLDVSVVTGSGDSTIE